MHIPEGMLSTPVALVTDLGAAGIIGYSTYWVKRYFSSKKVVLMAVLGALIFALQMLNFPISGGTSGHFAGGTLAGIILGPYAGSIVMTAVLAVQAFVFKDGGILALGANIINMGVIAPFLGYLLYRVIVRASSSTPRKVAASAIAAWVGAVVSAFAVALEIWLSGNANFMLIMSSMLIVHAVIGLGEAAITGGLVGYLATVRPTLLEGATSEPTCEAPPRQSLKGVVITLGVIALIATGFSWLASSHPDGLEFVYFNQKIGAPVREFSLIGDGGLLADYSVRGLSSATLGTILAGIVGVCIVGAILWLLFAKKRVTHHEEGKQ